MAAKKKSHLVEIEKNGVRIKVHPDTLESHLKLGWWEVNPAKPKPAPKAKSEAES